MQFSISSTKTSKSSVICQFSNYVNCFQIANISNGTRFVLNYKYVFLRSKKAKAPSFTKFIRFLFEKQLHNKLPDLPEYMLLFCHISYNEELHKTVYKIACVFIISNYVFHLGSRCQIFLLYSFSLHLDILLISGFSVINACVFMNYKKHLNLKWNLSFKSFPISF